MGLLTVSARTVSAQSWDASLFAGLAFPTYDERLTLGRPSFSGVEVTVPETPTLQAEGGTVFGGTLGYGRGPFGIEARLDSTAVELEFSGARYDLRGTVFPFQGLSASLIAAPGQIEADRVSLLSLNARFRTPGRLALVASGGVSYLPGISVNGAVPLRLEAPGLGGLGDLTATLSLRAAPDESEHRFGVNGGAGIRFGERIALVADARVFYFGEYRLRFTSPDGPALLEELLAGAAPVRFSPVFVNVQVGAAFRF